MPQRPTTLKMTDTSRSRWGRLEEWLKIQVALIEGGQCDPVSAFLARIMVPGPDGKVVTLSEKFRQQLLLPAGSRQDSAAA